MSAREVKMRMVLSSASMYILLYIKYNLISKHLMVSVWQNE